MDENYNIPNHLFTSIRHEFDVIRVIDTIISPARTKIRIDITTHESEQENSEALDEYGFRMEVATSKIRYFVENILNKSVLLFSDNDWGIQTFLGSVEEKSMTNNIVLCPEHPTDACLCELLMSKFTALTNGAFDIHGIEVESSDSQGMVFTFVGDSPGESFVEMSEWVGENYYFSKPWWRRDDASTVDFASEEESDLSVPPSWAHSLGFIAERLAPKSRPSNIVRAEFRPRIVKDNEKD